MANHPKNVRHAADMYHAGEMSLDDLAGYVRGRQLATNPEPDEAQMWGAADAHVPGPDEWGTLATDPRFSPEEYTVLSRAHDDSLGVTNL